MIWSHVGKFGLGLLVFALIPLWVPVVLIGLPVYMIGSSLWDEMAGKDDWHPPGLPRFPAPSAPPAPPPKRHHADQSDASRAGAGTGVRP